MSSAADLAAEVFINVTFLFRLLQSVFLNEGAAQKGAAKPSFSGSFYERFRPLSAHIAVPGPTMHFANRHTRMHSKPPQGKRLHFSKRSK